NVKWTLPGACPTRNDSAEQMPPAGHTSPVWPTARPRNGAGTSTTLRRRFAMGTAPRIRALAPGPDCRWAHDRRPPGTHARLLRETDGAAISRALCAVGTKACDVPGMVGVTGTSAE